MQSSKEKEYKRFIKYFFFTFIPLISDFIVFFLLNNFFNNLPIFYSNLISSSVAFTISYNLESKLIFKVKRSFLKFFIYILYSFLSIYFFSYFLFFIYLNKIFFDNPKIFYKISLLPFSFIVNYLFKKIILQLNIKFKNKN